MQRTRTVREYAYLVFTGITMGAADVVPGVSGGTMAFIMGIYEELLDAIKAFNLTLVGLLLRLKLVQALHHVPWRFLLFLGAGILGSFVMLAGAIDWLLENEPVLLYAFFFGLIVASIGVVGVHIRWSALSCVGLALGTGFAYWMVGLVPVEMPHDWLTLFFSGMIAITAMILPGISGSFLLLILGQYDFVIEQVEALRFFSLTPLALGCLVGITCFVRLLSWLLHTYHQMTIAVLVGFMVGSLRRIWPFKTTLETMVDRHGQTVPLIEANVLPPLDATFWFALGLSLVGFLLVYTLSRLAVDDS